MRSIELYGGRIIENTGGLCDVGEYVRTAFPNAEKAFVITDIEIAENTLHYETVLESLEKSGFDLFSAVGPLGEREKVLSAVERLGKTASRHNMRRNDVFVSLGGGIICDTVGMTAALYMRGAGLCHIPTTIIAQCDAAAGGKCGVNLMRLKNRIGTFYHPGLVYIDTDVLSTLPKHEYSSGMAEVIKYGAIADRELFGILEKGNFDMADVIMRCLKIKCDVVTEDERDTGKRHILNFGHTVGHAIEEQSKHKYTHGEAVAIGMVKMALVGEWLGITAHETAQKIAEVCARYGLKTAYKDKKYISFIGDDKKSTSDSIEAVFINDIGKCEIRKVLTKELGEMLYELH